MKTPFNVKIRPVRNWIGTVKSITCLSVILSAAYNSDASCVTPLPGIIAWWPGDADATDLLTSNNGQFVGGATLGDGMVQSSFHFDGINDTVAIPSAASLNHGTGDFSVEFWARFEDLANNENGLLSKDSFNGGSTYSGWVINIFDGAGGFGFQTRKKVGGVGPDTHARWATGNLTPQTWYHIAAIRHSSVLSLYVNGVLRASATEPQPTDVSCPTELTIGSRNSSHIQAFHGAIDEVAIYNRALSAGEVSAIYGAGVAGKCKSLFIVTQPQSQLSFWGKTAAFSVTVLGTQPLGYQWFFGTNQIANATNSTLALTNLQFTNAGNYSVVITNSTDSVTSDPAVLSINPAGVDIALYPGVKVDGVIGLTYGIQSTTTLNNTNSWVGRTNLTLSSTPVIWYDSEPATSQPQTFYRVVPGPIPIP